MYFLFVLFYNLFPCSVTMEAMVAPHRHHRHPSFYRSIIKIPPMHCVSMNLDQNTLNASSNFNRCKPTHRRGLLVVVMWVEGGTLGNHFPVQVCQECLITQQPIEAAAKWIL